MSIIRSAAIALLLFYCGAYEARACDLCAIYNSLDAKRPQAGTFRLGAAEQFTYQGKIQDSGHYIENEHHQHLASSITQMAAGYDFTNHFSIQGNLPYINRRFKRLKDEKIQEGTEAGIGDLSVIAKYAVIRFQENDSIAFLQLFGGIELPTGDSDRLGEELEEGHHEVEEDHHEPEEDHHESEVMPHATTRHGGVDHEGAASAIHGHDLALGSGSYDFPIGASIFVQKGRTYVSGDIQYLIRTEGDFDYQYANDLIWNVGPAYFVPLGETGSSIAGRANLSGEYKAKDELDGENQNDTAVNSLFLGPEIVFTTQHLSGNIGVDLPLEIDNSDLQTVASYRLRAGISGRF